MKAPIKERGKVFRDPVHRLIKIDPEDAFLLNLIDTPVFQRLRRIRQLGVSWLTYHGAEHSRFSHSMGVFNFAQRIHRSLIDRYKKNDELRHYLESHSKELKAAALLHDIGHGPFSHMLERAFEHSLHHEERTIELILDPDGDIAKCLLAADVEPRKVADIIEGTSKDRLIIDIVSSQLDADRMDYLLRDSLFTGVEYGRYDAEWVVRNLCIGKDTGLVEGATGFTRHRLCLDRDRGLHSAEQLILARMHMTMQVYMHRVTRGYETLLLCMFRLAARLAQSNLLPSGTPEVVIRYFNNTPLSPMQWNQFDETAMFSAMSCWANSTSKKHATLKRMAESFLLRRHVFKSRKIDQEKLGLGGVSELSTKLDQLGKKGIEWEFDDGKMVCYKGLRYTAIRTSRSADAEEQSADSILLSSGDPNDKAVAVETESRVFQAIDLANELAQRVYFDIDRESEYANLLARYGSKEER